MRPRDPWSSTWTFTITTTFGAGTPGSVQIRAAVPVDAAQTNFAQSDYQTIERGNHIYITAITGGLPTKATPLTLTGRVTPVRGGDQVIIDAIDGTGHYRSHVADTQLKSDGTWTVTIDLSAYPSGYTRFRAAVYNGWWGRCNYVGYSIN